jgi:hypothetical protein
MTSLKSIIWLQREGEVSLPFEERSTRKKVRKSSSSQSSQSGAGDKSPSLSKSTPLSSDKEKDKLPSSKLSASSTSADKKKSRRGAASLSSSKAASPEKESDVAKEPLRTADPAPYNEPIVKLVSFADIMAGMQAKQQQQQLQQQQEHQQHHQQQQQQQQQQPVALEPALDSSPPKPTVDVTPPVQAPQAPQVPQVPQAPQAPAASASAPTSAPSAAESARAHRVTSSDVQFVDESDAAAARDRVQSGDTKTAWCLFSYAVGSTSTLALEACGADLAELRSRLAADRVQFALLRWSQNVLKKFVAVFWCGAGVAAMTKARTAPHKPSVLAFFRNVHHEIVASTAADVTDAAISSVVLRGAGQQAAGVTRKSPMRAAMHTMHREPQVARAQQQQQQQDAKTSAAATDDAAPKRVNSLGRGAAAGAGAATDVAVSAFLVSFGKASPPCWLACGLKSTRLVDVAVGDGASASATRVIRERWAAKSSDAVLVLMRVRQLTTYGWQERTALVEAVEPTISAVRRARMQPERLRARSQLGHHNVFIEVLNEADLDALDATLTAALAKL